MHRRLLGILVLALVVATVVAAVIPGTPEKLPSAALGSPLVLIALRAVALFAPALLALVVVVQAFEGRLPTKLGKDGVEYATVDAANVLAQETAVALEEMGDRLLIAQTANEDVARLLAEAVASVETRLDELEEGA